MAGENIHVAVVSVDVTTSPNAAIESLQGVGAINHKPSSIDIFKGYITMIHDKLCARKPSVVHGMLSGHTFRQTHCVFDGRLFRIVRHQTHPSVARTSVLELAIICNVHFQSFLSDRNFKDNSLRSILLVVVPMGLKSELAGSWGWRNRRLRLRLKGVGAKSRSDPDDGS